jgi:predicted nucleotidyltransferase
MSETIDRAVDILTREMKPRKIILFGSTARGDAGPDSDLDLIVVIDHVDSRIAEMRRASALLSSLGVPVDVLVYSQAEVDEWGTVTNHVINEALLDGRVIYDAA